jgi:hypothetical protein
MPYFVFRKRIFYKAPVCTYKDTVHITDTTENQYILKGTSHRFESGFSDIMGQKITGKELLRVCTNIYCVFDFVSI